MSQLRSTGRPPSFNLNSLRELLTRWFDEDVPSVSTLAREFDTCEASVRKYLKLGLGTESLPRGRAATLSRERQNVQALVNAVDTAELLGEGRVELLRRRREDGASIVDLAREFEVSRRRVRGLLRRLESQDSLSEAA